MVNTRLIKLMEFLSKKELKDFSKFIRSPFFNTRADLILLFEIIEKNLNAKPEKLNKEVIFKKLYPNRSFDPTHFNLIRSYLLKLLEQYLSVSEFMAEKSAQNKNLVKVLRQKNNKFDTNRAIKSSKEFLDKQPYRDESFFEEQLNLDWEKYYLKSETIHKEHIVWENLSEQTDKVYFIRKLRIAVLSKATEQVLNEQTEPFHLFDEIIEKAQKPPFLEVHAIQIYLTCFQMLNQPDQESYFFEFKKQLISNSEKFQDHEIRDLYLLGINFCIKQVNNGAWEARYFEEVLSLYKDGLEKKIILQDGVLSRFTYHNIVAAALKIQDYEWVEWFIEVYKNLLKKPYRESSYGFNKARLAYAKKNYEEALLQLQNSNYRDLLLNLAARTIKSKIYFETDEWDALSAHLEATNIYLRRKKVIGYHRKFYENLIRYTQKLMAINFYDKKAVEQLRSKIEKEENLTEKQWLIEQLGGV